MIGALRMARPPWVGGSVVTLGPVSRANLSDPVRFGRPPHRNPATRRRPGGARMRNRRIGVVMLAVAAVLGACSRPAPGDQASTTAVTAATSDSPPPAEP